MHALTVRFTMPEGTDWAAIREMARQRVPLYEAMPGLVSKAFVLDPETRAYGGLYVWEAREQIDAFLASELFQGFVTRLGQPEIRVFEVAATVGLPTPAAAQA